MYVLPVRFSFCLQLALTPVNTFTAPVHCAHPNETVIPGPDRVSPHLKGNATEITAESTAYFFFFHCATVAYAIPHTCSKSMARILTGETVKALFRIKK